MSTHKTQAIWHHALHPAVKKHLEANAFPQWLGRYLHPTAATLSMRGGTPGQAFTEGHPCTAYERGEDSDGSTFQQRWRSRRNRKHRYLCAAPGQAEPSRHADTSWVALWHMATRLEYWNISWWVAQAFTWGSVVWCLNGFFSFMPLLYPSTFAQSHVSTGWTAFAGATIFEFGSVFGLWEAWNREERTSFGWNVSRELHKLEDELEEVAARALGEVGPSMNGASSRLSTSSGDIKHPKDGESGGRCQGLSESSTSDKPLNGDPEKGLGASKKGSSETSHKRWIWFSTDTKYFREVGFLAAFFQMMGATIFWISGFTAIPAIQEAIQKHTGVLDGVFWLPQVIGGMGFVISSTFIMLETQSKWYKPKPLDIGWHVGLWNFIGGVGFTTCGALGFGAASNTGVNFQSVLCTFWGSWAFLIGSIAQWYESVNCV